MHVGKNAGKILVILAFNKLKQGVVKLIDFESGTTYSENPAYGWVFAFLGMEIRSPHLRPD